MPPEDIANIVNRAMSSKDVVNQHMDVLGNYLEQLQEYRRSPSVHGKIHAKKFLKRKARNLRNEINTMLI
jgi:hypothetical protein